MKAVVITRSGGAEVLEVQERPAPEPGVNGIRVRVRASALNRADILQRKGSYPVPPGAPPDIGGLEYAGEVDAVGPGATMWKTGDPVMGIVGGGGHAEYVCVHEREAIAVPKRMSLDEAAAIPEAFMTAHDALFTRLALGVGETVLVHAVASGVGTAALQLARVAGARVIGTSRSPAKLARARKLGLDAEIDASRKDWVAQIEASIGVDGVDAVVDLVGGNYLEGNLRVLAVRGRMVVVGLTAGATTQLDMGVLLRKRITIVGTVLRARPLEEKIGLARDFSERVVPLFESGRITPVIDRIMSFSQIRGAHDLMESNETFGKIVLRW
jgi:putative PIG3 family NAD(P)H quinone oxidoreductase